MLGLGQMNSEQATNKIQETLDIVRQINVQFKDPVRRMLRKVFTISNPLGIDYIRLRLYCGIPVDVRDRTPHSGIDQTGLFICGGW